MGYSKSAELFSIFCTSVHETIVESELRLRRQPLSPVPFSTAACIDSHSIAITLGEAMLRPLPQAPVGGKTPASSNPFVNRF